MNFFKKMFSGKEVKGQTIQNDYFAMLNAISNGLSCQPGKLGIRKKIGFIKENLYYLTNSAVASSVDTIAEKFSEIVPVLQDKQTKEIIRDHPVLDLLAMPNKNLTREKFMFKYAAFFLINGNTFINSIGLVTQPPNELDILRPTGMTFTGTSLFDQVTTYRYNTQGFSIEYKINVDSKHIRYFTSSNTAELWHTKMFNPEDSSTQSFGTSLMNAIQLEIEQFAQANNHNLALLNNGARMSGILTTEASLTKDQREFMKDQFKLYQGAENTGKVLFVEGGGGKVKYNELSQSAKDMDFKDLRTQNKLIIHGRFKVPLPLVSSDHMTLSNFREARLALYDEAVIPLINILYGELQDMLFSKYSDLKNGGLILTFDEQTILPLKERSDISIERKQKTGSFTINEIRNMFGVEDIEGGDVLYQAINLVPLGSNGNTLTDDEKQLVNILRKSNE